MMRRFRRLPCLSFAALLTFAIATQPVTRRRGHGPAAGNIAGMIAEFR